MKKQYKVLAGVLAVGLVTLGVYQANGRNQKVESKPLVHVSDPKPVVHVNIPKVDVHVNVPKPSPIYYIDQLYAQAHYKQNETRSIGKFDKIKLNTDHLYVKVVKGKQSRVKVSGPAIKNIKTSVQTKR